MDTTRTAKRGAGIEVAAQDRFHHAVDEKRDQDGREGELDVRDPHDDGVGDPAEITRQQTEGDSQRRRECDAEKPDQQRNPQAVENGRQDVAPLLVGSEQEGRLSLRIPEWRKTAVHEFELRGIEGVLRGQQAGKQRAQKEQQRQRGRHHGELGALEACPHIAVEKSRQPRGRTRRDDRIDAGGL